MQVQGSGWIGRNYLMATLTNNPNQSVVVWGTLSNSNINMDEVGGRVRGTVSGFDTYLHDVDVQVDRLADGSTHSQGMVGVDAFSLDSRPTGPGRQHLEGRLGSKTLSFDRTDSGLSETIQGWVEAPGGIRESVNVQLDRVDGPPGLALEAVYPLLGLVGPALRESRQGA